MGATGLPLLYSAILLALCVSYIQGTYRKSNFATLRKCKNKWVKNTGSVFFVQRKNTHSLICFHRN